MKTLMPPALRLAMLCAWLGLSAVSTGHAQGPEPRQERRDEEARALFMAGKSAFEDGRFEDALVEFKRAHERSGRPELLYNIGLAAMELGRNDEARMALQGFVAAAPEGQGVENARLRLDLLQLRIAQEAASRQIPPEAVANDTQAAAPVVHEARAHHRYTWLAAGVAVTLGATALGVGLKAQSDYRDLSRECRPAGEATCSQARVDDASLSQRALATNVLAVGAGLALAAGVVLFFYEGRERGDTKLSARVGPTSLVLSGSF